MKENDYVKFVINKNSNNYEIDKAIAIVKKNENNFKNNLLLGKLYTKKKQLETAKQYLNNAKEINPKKTVVYYNLFIVNIYSNEYLEALENIKKANYASSNYSVLIYMLEKLTNKTSEEIIKNNLIRNFFIKEDGILIEEYNKFIDLLETGQYKQALNKLKDCMKIENINFSIEIELLTKLIEKEEKLVKQKIATALIKKDMALKKDDLNKYIENTYILYNLNYGSCDFYLKDINYLIEKDLETAKKLLNEVTCKYKNIDEYKLEYLKNKIKEKEMKKHDMVDYYLKKGHEAYNKFDLKYALIVYYLALTTTKDNVFNYYVGKIAYKLKDYECARRYLNIYILNGAEKASKSLLYLYKIEQAYKNKRKANQYETNMNYLNQIEDSSFNKMTYKERKIKIKEEEFRK